MIRPLLLLALLASLPAFAREDPREALQAGGVEVMQLYNTGQYEQAYARAVELQEQAKVLRKSDPARLDAQLRLGDALYGVDRFTEAVEVYSDVFERTRKPKTFEALLIVIEAASNLGAAHHQLGDLAEAREWHEVAWSLLVQMQVYVPLRFVVASQFADTALAQGDVDTARTLRHWVVESLAHELQTTEHPQVADAEVAEADFSIAIGELDAAQALLAHAIAVYEAHGEALKLAHARHSLAGLYLTASRAAEARPLLDAAEAGMNDVLGTESSDLVDSLRTTRAELERQEGNHAASLALNEAVLARRIAVYGEHHLVTARTRSRRALALRELSRLQEAEPEMRLALADLEAALGADHRDVASLTAALAQICMDLGRVTEALEISERSVAVLEHSESGASILPSALASLARAQHVAGRHAESEATYLRAIQAFEEQVGPDNPETALAHNAYGALLLDLERVDEAEARFRLSLAVLEATRGPDHPDITSPVNNLAYARQGRGDFVAAQHLYERALEVLTAWYGEDSLERAEVIHNVGVLHLQRGDLAGAKLWLERSIAVKSAVLGPDNPDLGSTYGQLAQIAVSEKRTDEALALARRGLAVEESAGADRPEVALALDKVAMVLSWMGRYDEARAVMERSLAIARAHFGHDAPRTSETLARLATLTYYDGDLEGAIALHRQALAVLPPSVGPEHANRLWLEREIAVLTGGSGDMVSARAELARVLEVEERAALSQIGTLSERERLAFMDVYRTTLVELLWAEGTDGGDPEKAYEAVLHFKGLASRTLAVEQPARLARVDPVTYARWREVRSELSDLTMSDVPAAAARLSALTQEKDALRRKLAQAAQTEGSAVEQLGPRELCASLPEGTAVVDFVRHGHVQSETLEWKGDYTAFVLPAGCRSVSRVELGDATSLDAAIGKYRDLLASRAPTSRVDRQGEKVRATLWDPIAPFLDGIDQVFVVPDGAVATVAFAALPADGGYLLDRIAFRSLDTALDARPVAGRAEQSALVVGGVDYGPGPDRTASTRAACTSEFPALPATASESADVAALLRSHGAVRTLTGSQATEAALTGAIGEASVVHLATHGFFATGECRAALERDEGQERAVGMNPMLLSGLALAGANRDPRAIWTAEEIATLPLDGVDLVVLSACETGLGEIADGEGLLGLRRAFTLSGARATVMSLWPVDDAATGTLMKGFYEALLADPRRDEAAALRAAQRALLERNRAELGEARPETWAAFVVSGSPRAPAE
ncbi:MAG: CHAT domain-containing tetratricopeptide repeat protein [Myxococcota bacterium]